MTSTTELTPSSNQDSHLGTIIEVSGTVIDVEFPRQHTPDIFNLLQVLIPATSTSLKAKHQ